MYLLLWSIKTPLLFLLKHFKAITATSALLALAGCSLLPGQLASPAQQISPGQQVTEEPPRALTALTANKKITPQRLWQYKLNTIQQHGYIKLRPTLSASALFAADLHTVYAFNKKTGEVLWKEKLPGTITAGLSTGKNTVFVGTEEGAAIAFDNTTGKTRWITLLEQPIVSISSGKKGKVVFRTLNGKIHVLSTANGDPLWQRTQRTPILSLQGSSSPIIAGPFVVAGFDNGSVVAYELETGKESWSTKLGLESSLTELSQLIDIDAEMKAIGTALFAVSYQGFLAGIDMRSGRTGWKRKLSSHSGIDANEKELFVTDNQGILWKLNPLTGDPVWKNDDLERRAPTAPALLGQSLLVVGDKEGYLHWYDRKTGTIIGRTRSDNSRYTAAPVVEGNQVYTLNSSGLLSTYGLNQ